MNNLVEKLKQFPNPMKGKKEIEALAPYLQRTDENLQAKVEIAEAYTYSEQSFEVSTKLFVKDDATLRNNSCKEIATVKKGAEVTVLEHKRFFVIATAIKDYKVAIGKTKGWLYEYDLTTVTPEGKPKNKKESVVPIKKSPLE